MANKIKSFGLVSYGYPKINGNELIGGNCCITSSGFSLCEVSNGGAFSFTEGETGDAKNHEIKRDNARRIAACINYCDGMSVDEIELSISKRIKHE